MGFLYCDYGYNCTSLCVLPPFWNLCISWPILSANTRPLVTHTNAIVATITDDNPGTSIPSPSLLLYKVSAVLIVVLLVVVAAVVDMRMLDVVLAVVATGIAVVVVMKSGEA